MLKSASTSQGLLRPGTVIDRNGSTQSQKPLERDLAFKKPFSRRQQPPSLLRSATAPALKGLKRESSEISLSDIPLKRPSVEKSKRYSQREVDLSAISNATEAKLRRKASVEEELRGAIATLKKPNRTLAVKELVESIEHRVHSAGASSRSKSSTQYRTLNTTKLRQSPEIRSEIRSVKGYKSWQHRRVIARRMCSVEHQGWLENHLRFLKKFLIPYRSLNLTSLRLLHDPQRYGNSPTATSGYHQTVLAQCGKPCPR